MGEEKIWMEMTFQQKSLRKLLLQIPKISLNQRLDTLRFVIMDTETTGFDPSNGDKIISLGAVVFENGKISKKDTFYELVNPVRDIPEEISDLTGIKEQTIKNKPDLSTVLSRFISWAGKSVLVGHFIEFDLSFLNKYLINNRNARLKYKTIDTQMIAKYLFPGLESYSLEVVCSYLGITCKKRHHALGDAITTAKLFELCYQLLLKRSIFTLKDLDNCLRFKKLFIPALSQV